MEKLSTCWSWTITRDLKGITIVLKHDTDEKKVKSFFLAGARNIAALESHMLSLTDDNCDGFWPRPREKKAKPESD